jgi:hypothetical protein
MLALCEIRSLFSILKNFTSILICGQNPILKGFLFGDFCLLLWNAWSYFLSFELLACSKFSGW